MDHNMTLKEWLGTDGGNRPGEQFRQLLRCKHLTDTDSIWQLRRGNAGQRGSDIKLLEWNIHMLQFLSSVSRNAETTKRLSFSKKNLD